MIRAETDGDLGALLDRITKGLDDLSPLSPTMSDIVSRGNAEGVGTDADGDTLAPLKASTLERRKGTGPPLAPNGLNSRIVTESVVSVTGSGSSLDVELSWPTLPWMRYAQSGTRNMPARDIIGVRPKTMESVNDALLNYWVSLFQ